MKQRVFVIGAGCSFDRFGVLTNNLFEVLWKRGLRKDKDLRSLLKYLYPARFDGRVHPDEVNIEDLLSCIDAAVHLEGINEKGKFSKERLLRARGSLVSELVSFFWIKDSSLDSSYLAFAKQLDPSDVIITFNYDIELERAISKRTGVEIHQLYFPAHKHYEWRKWPTVLKLHGSINLAEVDGQMKRMDKPSQCTKPIILAPTIFKDPKSVSTYWWERARVSLSQAKEVWFVGYSLPTLDFAARYILRRGIRMLLKKRPDTPINVVDPSPEVLKRYISQIHSRIEYKRATFAEFVEEILPKKPSN